MMFFLVAAVHAVMIAFVMLCRLHLVEMNQSILALSLNCEVGRGGRGET